MAHHKLRRLHRCLIIPVAAALLLGPVGPASGQTDAVPTVTVTANAVELAWPVYPGATAYLVIDDRTHQVIWRGHQTSARLPVQAPTSVSLLVVALSDQGPRTVSKTLATVPDAASGLTPLTATTTSTGTTIRWGALPDVRTYTVTSDGKDIGRTADTRVQVDAVHGERVKYEIEATRDLPVSAITQNTVTQYSYGVEVTPATTDVQQTPSNAQPGDTLAPSSVYQLATSTTDYETYIPLSKLDAPEDGLQCEAGDGYSDYWFAGDIRTGPGYQTGQYRTKGEANHYWQYRNGRTSKSVHYTERWRKLGDAFFYDSKRLANDDGFTIRQLQNDGRYARTVIEHDVGNPYCARVADISYVSQQDLYQNGSHWIYGTHDKMPNHQFYRNDIYFNGSSSYQVLDLVFNHKMVAPECLAGVFGFCSTWQYQYTR